MRWRWLLPVVLVLLVGASLVVVQRVLHTEAGLHMALEQLRRVPGVTVETIGATGTLAGPIMFRRVSIDHAAVHIDVRNLTLDASLRSLLSGDVFLEHATAEGMEITLKRREPQPPSDIRFLPRFLEVVVPDLQVRNLGLTLADGRRYHVAAVRGALAMSRWRIDLSDLAVEDPLGRIDGAITLRATTPLGLRGAANGRWQLPDERTWRFAAAVSGNLDRLATTVTLDAPAQASFVGNTVDLTGEPRIVGTLRTTEFDGTPWFDAGVLPRTSGSVSVDVGADGFGLDGTLTADVFGDGPVRVQGNGRWRDQTLELASFRAWLPRSSLTLTSAGTARFAGDAPQLELRGEWTAMRWPLVGEAAVESTLGTYTLQGALPYRFDVQAQVRAPLLDGTPEAQFTATGSLDNGLLVVDRIDGSALGGRLSGSGRVSWTGDQPWSARIQAQNVDITTLRPDLPGRISTVATVEGRGFELTSPWTARLASLSGTVRGRALTGRGEVAHRDGNYDLRGVRVANGESHVDIDGRWGSTVDLRWSADVRTLSLLHPDLAGALVSSGRARGSAQRPQLDGEVSARQLRFGDTRVASLQGEVALDLTDASESRIDLRATSIDLGVVLLDTARFELHGRTAQHDLALEFSSTRDDTRRLPGFDGRLAGRGEFEVATRHWRGRIEDATLAYEDGRATLLQPAAVEVSPNALRAEPVCLQTGDARLCAEGERIAEPASMRALFSAQDWPLERLLRSVLGWRELDGKLQGAGWITQQGTQPWVGGLTMYVDDPTLAIPRNQFRSEQVRLGRAQFDLTAEPEELRARLEMNIVEGTQLDGEVVATRDPGQDFAGQPLRGEIRARSTSLKSLPLFVPEIDRSDGILDAALVVSGTLGEPSFDGEFHVRDGRFDLYRTNLLLTSVMLDGRFVGDELVFDGSGQTAKGTLGIEGRFTWPDGVMTGQMRLKGDQLMVANTPDFRVTASPDLLFTAGADGFDVTGEVLIPMARITPRDLSTTVSTSADERIVGAEDEDDSPSTLGRVRSRIRVVLGDNVRVDSWGLKARLEGAVTVVTQPDDVVRGDGAIRIVDGVYKAFGQFVKIRRGELSYRMTPLNSPALDLVGDREIKGEDIVVSINVRGTLDQPFITLSSVPAMPENEALSYLITGRSINTLQTNEAASLDRAAESLAVSGGGLLLGSLGTRYGLDEVSVERTDDDDTAVVLGKYLTPKLFVSYGISIAETINTIKLRYTLNERWALKAEAGLHQSADVEYRIER
jgi:translocation and assembly module TamB